MKVGARVNSMKGEMCVVELLTKVGDNDYLVKLPSGIVCHAIYNIFSGCYYADDVYAIVEAVNT